MRVLSQRRLQFVAFLSLLFVASLAPAQSAASAPKRQTSTPYTGDLSVFDAPDREKKLQLDRVMEVLGIAPGKAVADIGAGSGWCTVRAARRTGPSGTVYAVD